MKIKKRKKTKRKKDVRLFKALALGMLAISGGALALPIMDQNPNLHLDRFSSLKNNPGEIFKMNKVNLNKNFDYFEELNKEFSEDSQKIFKK